MKNTKVKKLKFRLFVFLSLIDLIIIVTSYNLLPIVINYPPYAESDLEFQNQVEPLNHLQQYAIVFLLATAICFTTIELLMKNIYSFLKKYYAKKQITQEEIKRVRRDCANVPYIFYILEIAVCLILAFLLFVSLNNSNISLFRCVLFLLAIIALTALLQFMFLQRNLKRISLMTYDQASYFERNDGFRIKFSSNLILQIIPFLLVAIIAISLYGYAKSSTQRANGIANYYEVYLNSKDFSDVSFSNIRQQIETIPKYNKSDYYIIMSEDENIYYTSNPTEEITDFFKAYLKNFFYKSNGIVYEYYGYEKQAYMQELVDNTGKKWYVGFEYVYTDYSLIYSYVGIIITVSIMYVVFIYIWSRNISSNLTTLSQALDYVRKENDYNLERYLPIFSNDEFGDLAYSFNKIEKLMHEHMKEIQNNQDILVEQERLASLGQMIGGIGHNLKTPIFSVAGGLEDLSDLINEFDESIGNPTVNDQDMHEIAADMREWIKKLRGHIAYMSDVITAVKGQTVALSDNNKIKFSISELFKRVDILMKHEIKNSLSTLKIENNVGEADILFGNINSLVQIINNIISNAIEAYGNTDKEKIIELTSRIVENNVIISIKDYGPGIPEKAQEKLFKEMITTKGKNGTGLGMFMSYSNIKAHFNGDLKYETELGKGTIFYIILPITQ